MAAATEANANTCEKRIYFKRLYMQTEYNVLLL